MEMSREELLNLFNISDTTLIYTNLPVALVRRGEQVPFAEIMTKGDKTRLVVNGQPSDNAIRIVI